MPKLPPSSDLGAAPGVGSYERALRHIDEGRLEDAVEDFGDAVARDPADAMSYTNRGVILARLGRRSDAIDDLERACRLRPDLPLGPLHLGRLFAIGGELDSALNVLDEAIAGGSRFPPHYVDRARSHIALGRLQAAIDDLERARTLGDESSETLILLGQVHQTLRQPQPAVSALLHALCIEPQNAFAHGLCGHNLLRLGEVERGRHHVERSLQIDPDFRAAHIDMAGILASLGESEKSEHHMRRAQALPRREAPQPRDAIDPLAVDRLAAITPEMLRDIDRHRPPFTFFSGKGYRVASDLAPLQSLALALAFPAFRGRATIEPPSREARPVDTLQQFEHFARDTRRKLVQRHFARRRWSGDTHCEVARSRYFALGGPSDAPPVYTLAAEMNAYALPHRTGYAAAMASARPDCIDIVFRGLNDEPNPLYQFMTDPRRFTVFDGVPADPRDDIAALGAAQVPSTHEFLVSLPLESVEVHLASAFDLRRPQARQWLVDLFRHPPSCIGEDDLIHGEVLQQMARQYGFDLQGVASWQALLPVTNSNHFGGNGLTDLVACLLRRLGCDGLIFPSARCDHGVVVEHGGPVFSWGWNLVDFRGLPMPTTVALEEHAPLPPMTGIRHHAELADGRFKGSFTHLGNSLHQLLVNQLLLEGHCQRRASDSTAEEGAGTFAVRGFSWFSRRYGRAGRADDHGVECAECGAAAPPEEAVLPRCRHCGYAGDTGNYIEVPRMLKERLEALQPHEAK